MPFSYSSLLTYKDLPPPHHMPMPPVDVEANGSDLCYVHVGKSGGNSITAALYGMWLNGTLRRLVVLHAALHAPTVKWNETKQGHLSLAQRFGGPFAAGLPGYLACVATRRVLLWVRDPLSRFLSTWHATICCSTPCSERRKNLWASAAAMGVTGNGSGGRSTIDLNPTLTELARRDGGLVPSTHTFELIRGIHHGATGLAAYLTDCSPAFLRRQPLLYVGRTESMLDDWRELWGSRGQELAQTHHYTQPCPSRQLSSSGRAWLRAFYEDDLRCMRSLEEVGKLSSAYLAQVTSDSTIYEYWPVVMHACGANASVCALNE